MITAVIPNWNGLKVLEPCCTSLWATTSRDELRILVVDNGSRDGSVEWLRARAAEGVLEVIENGENLGFAKATNQGARASSGDVLFLNNDIVALPGWLAPLRAALAADPTVGAAGSLLLYPGCRVVQHAGVRVGRIDGRMKVYHRGQYRHLEAVPELTRSDFRAAVTAACMLVRREAIEQHGLLDESFVNGYEDVDFCLRLHHGGWRIAYRGDSVLEHHESITPGRHNRESENRSLCFSRWQDRIVPEVVDTDCRREMQEIDRRRRFIAGPSDRWNLHRMAKLLTALGRTEEAALWKRLRGRRLLWTFLEPIPEERRAVVRALGYGDLVREV